MTCTNEERKGTALVQKGKPAFLSPSPPVDGFFYPRSGCCERSDSEAKRLRFLVADGGLLAAVFCKKHDSGSVLAGFLFFGGGEAEKV